MPSMNPNHVMTRCVPTSAELDSLEDRFYEYNSAQTGRRDGNLFAFFIRDRQDQILAGLSGWTWAQACEIRHLWVDAAPCPMARVPFPAAGIGLS